MGTITSDGYTRTSLVDIQTEVETIYTDAYGSSFNFDVTTPQGQQIKAFEDIIDQLEDDKVDLANKFDLDSATDGWLDKLGVLIGIDRVEGSPSQIDVTITSNTTGFTIPAETEFTLLDDPEIIFINETAEVITSTTQSLLLYSKENQNYTITSGDKFQTSSSFPEIDDVEVTSYTDGVEVEDDDDYLARIKLLRSGAYRQSGVQRVSSALFELDGIIDAKVYSGTGSIQCVLLGADDDDIGNAILNTLDAGIDTTGDTSVTVQDFQDLDVIINFDRAEEVEIGLNLVYGLKSGQSLTLAEVTDIETKFINFMGEFKINDEVSASDFTDIVMNTYSSKIYIDSIDLIEATVSKKIVSPDLVSYVRADEADITITEVV